MLINHVIVNIMKASDKALLLAKNSFCKESSIESNFKKYFDILLKHENSASNTGVKLSLLEQADAALAIFCEKANLNEDVIKFIDECQKKLQERFKKLDELEKKQKEEDIASVVKFNEKILKELVKLKTTMSNVSSQSPFDYCLNKLAELDGSIDKDSLTEDQQNRYNELTSDFSKVVSGRVNYLNAIRERQYNSEALREIHTVYFRYKNDEKRYKVFNEDTKDLVSRLFNFNSSRLTTEVQIFYNHVYSYIFSKLNDEEKFALTEMSLRRFDME